MSRLFAPGRQAALAMLAGFALFGASAFAVGCGGDDADKGPAKFGKTRIAINLGLAAGASKKWIVDPAREDGFAKGAPKRKRTIAKALAAGAFSAKQLNDARKLAERDPELKPLLAKITGLTAVLGGLTAGLKDGQIDVPDLVGLGPEVDGLLDVGKTLGLDITERTPPGL